jgi:hypothetical protein
MHWHETERNKYESIEKGQRLENVVDKWRRLKAFSTASVAVAIKSSTKGALFTLQHSVYYSSISKGTAKMWIWKS